MRCLFLVLFSTLILSGCTTYIPTPEKAMAIGMNDDSRSWSIQFATRNPSGFLTEFVPEGDSINSWKELVSQATDFTQLPLNVFVENWEKQLASADPGISIEVFKNQDASITAKYVSGKANEIGVRRFIKSSDAVYSLTYMVRSQHKNEETYTTWEKIIKEAKLVPNPVK